MKIVDLLTDPTAHGGSASDAFHVVIPNMPGYGFSGKPTTTGWDPIRMGRAYVVLMKRLGYERFVAAGGDYGALVVDYMAGGRDAPSAPEPAPPELLGIHTNFPGVFPLDVDTAIKTGGEQSPDLSADERRAAEHLGAAYKLRRTPCRWGHARRRCTGSTTRPSSWPPTCSTTTRPATRR